VKTNIYTWKPYRYTSMLTVDWLNDLKNGMRLTSKIISKAEMAK